MYVSYVVCLQHRKKAERYTYEEQQQETAVRYLYTILTCDKVEKSRRRQPAVPERLRRVQDPAADHVVHYEERRYEPTVVLAPRALPKNSSIIVDAVFFSTRYFLSAPQ